MNLDHDELLYERRGGIAIVSLNRPKALNALTNRMIDDIAAIAAEVETYRERLAGPGEHQHS